MSWDDLLAALTDRTGMFVFQSYLLTASAMLDGFSRGRGDEVMADFQHWMSMRYPAEGGHPSPMAYPSLVAEALFQKSPWELTNEENRAAVAALCELVAEYRRA